MHSFHSNPVVANEFPGSLSTVGTAQRLPIPDLLGPLFFEGIEFTDFPMGAVLAGLDVVFHHVLKIT